MASLISSRGLTNLAVGAILPAVVFLVARRIWDLSIAIWLTGGWACSCQALRLLRRQPISGLLLLGMLELGLRNGVSLALHSARWFFLAPAATTALTGVLYIGSSVGRRRPLLCVVLSDLVPPSSIDLSCAGTRKLIRKMSILYGTEQLLMAGLSVVMVVNLTPTQYVVTHLTVSWCLFGAVLALGAAAFKRDLAAWLPDTAPATDTTIPVAAHGGCGGRDLVAMARAG